MEPIDHSYPEPEKGSARLIGVRYGIILSLIGLGVQLFTYLTGGDDPEKGGGLGSVIGCLSIVIVIAVIIMAIKTYRDNVLGGFLSFTEGMSVMFWLALVYSIYTALSNWLYNNVIAPEANERVEQLIEKTRALVEDGEADPLELTVIETTYQVMNNPLSVMVITFVILMVIGAIASLILTRARSYQ